MQKRRFDVEDAPFDVDDEAPAYQRRSRQSIEEAEAEVESDGEETVVPFVTGRKRIKNSRPQGEGGLYFRWPEEGETAVVKFLEADIWAYNQHWVTREGKKSFPCIGEDCPLCKIGSKVNQKIVYSLVNFNAEGGPAVQILEVTPTLDDTLTNYDTDSKTGPLTKMYWALSRTKAARSASFAKYNYSFLPIKERDLEEDWGIDLNKADAVLEKAEAPDPAKILGKVQRKTLQEIADEAVA